MDSTAALPQGVIPEQLLKGQKALVTGVNSGIGKATTIGLGRVGADVVVNYVAGRSAAEESVEEITSFGVRDAPFREMTFAQWQKVLDVNLTGQFLCGREATKKFRRRGALPAVSVPAGKIICMSASPK